MPTNPAGSYTPRSSAPAEPTALAVSGETAGQVLAAQAEALVKARYAIALRYPRDLNVVRQKLLKECERPSFARVAIYRKPVGKGIEGASIRFVEQALLLMGNISTETPAIYDDPEKRIIKVTVTDMETNVSHSKDVTIQKTVERRSIQDGDTVVRMRQNKDGQTLYVRLATDDEILNTENALGSKALRAEGLRVIPGWLVDECMTAIRATRKNADAKNPDEAKNQIFDAFGDIGVSVENLREWLGHDGATLQPKELSDLRGIYTAIKDGDTTWREVMDARWDETLERGAKSVDKASQAATALEPGKDPPSMSTPTRGPAAVKAVIAQAKPGAQAFDRRARVGKLRSEITNRVGAEPAKQAWMDACRDCTGGRTSTEWTEKDCDAVDEYLKKWAPEAAAAEKNGPKEKKDA